MSLRHAALQLLLLGVPRRLRGNVLGDLLEEGAGLREALSVVLHFQAEPWRDRAGRHVLLALGLGGGALLWALPLAAQGLLAQAAVFTDAFSRAALALWSAPAVLAAAACGLLVGRAPGLPTRAGAAQAQLVLLLAPAAALAAPGALQAVLAGVALPALAWLAHRSRPDVR